MLIKDARFVGCVDRYEWAIYEPPKLMFDMVGLVLAHAWVGVMWSLKGVV